MTKTRNCEEHFFKKKRQKIEFLDHFFLLEREGIHEGEKTPDFLFRGFWFIVPNLQKKCLVTISAFIRSAFFEHA